MVKVEPLNSYLSIQAHYATELENLGSRPAKHSNVAIKMHMPNYPVYRSFFGYHWWRIDPRENLVFQTKSNFNNQ